MVDVVLLQSGYLLVAAVVALGLLGAGVFLVALACQRFA